MSRRTGVLLGGVMVFLYVAVTLFSGSRGDPYQAQQTASSHPSDESYLLIIQQEVAPGTTGAFFDDEVKHALRRTLENTMENTRINLADSRGRVQGHLGNIHARVMLKDREYRGTGSDSFKNWSLPYYVKLDLEISSAESTSTWDGSFSAEAESIPPSRLAQAGMLQARTNQIQSLMKQLAEKLEARGLFHRY